DGWNWFLEWFTAGDREVADYLADFVASCFIPVRHETSTILVGSGSNGKSVFANAVSQFVGEENVSAVPLEAFGSRFGLMPTLNKLLNLVGDLNDLDRVQEGSLKSFISQDLITFDRKGISPITVRPTARLLICANRLPRVRDRSDGTWRRFV